ncbi:MAG: hypothetical protein Kow0022_17980 [Phycisphaerales bacterium]
MRMTSGTVERDAAMLGRIKALEGTWTMLDENGEEIVASVFRATAAGSAVQEVMFPGTEHEMVNVYHMDGDELVVTHYCAAGNQPRMVAQDVQTTAEGAQAYRFDLESVSNWRHGQHGCMANLTLTIDGDHLRQTWSSIDEKGNPAGTVVFELTRK